MVKTKQIMVRLGHAVHAAAEERAKGDDRTLAAWVRRLIHAELGMTEAEETPPELPDDVVATPLAPTPGAPKRVAYRCSKHKRIKCPLCPVGT
jgi:hypothetical protein